MPTLSERLKLLGVHKGTDEVRPPKERTSVPIEDVVAGRFIDAQNGRIFQTQRVFTIHYRHGHLGLNLQTPLRVIADWAGSDEIAENALQEFAFLDIETSSIVGGTGTYAFLIGVGRFIEQDFHLLQFFMSDPLEESALLIAFEEFLSPIKTIVTFNGKSSDAPTLNIRYTLQGWPSPLRKLAHIDLLHLSRRLWRDRLPSRTLSNLETKILGLTRSEEDLPGWMVPQIYYDYLRDGDARPLKRVFYHNEMDVVSMVALLNLVSRLLENHREESNIPASDHAALGCLFQDLGYHQQAEYEFTTSLTGDLPPELYTKTLMKLAALYKANGDCLQALPLWEQAASQGHIEAFIELAKYFEHRVKDISAAIHWTESAQTIINSTGYPTQDRQLWQNELEHRLYRLTRKSAKSSDQ